MGISNITNEHAAKALHMTKHYSRGLYTVKKKLVIFPPLAGTSLAKLIGPARVSLVTL
jgi:hypothetical protein